MNKTMESHQTNVKDFLSSGLFPYKNKIASVKETHFPKEENKCPLCGEMKTLTHMKTNNNYSTDICRSCAERYVINARKLEENWNKYFLKNVTEVTKIHIKQEIYPIFTSLKKKRKPTDWIDINTGKIYKELDIDFDQAQHGLCEKLKKPVWKHFGKRIVLVDISKRTRINTTDEELAKKPFTFHFKDASGKLIKYTLETPLEIKEFLKGMDEDDSNRELCIRISAPRELIKKIKIRVNAERERIEKKIKRDEKNERRKKYGKRRDSENIAIRGIDNVETIKPISGHE